MWVQRNGDKNGSGKYDVKSTNIKKEKRKDRKKRCEIGRVRGGFGGGVEDV